METDPRLVEFYQELYEEGERLRNREGQLEFVRTQELLGRFLPDLPSGIIDIGGGTGHYAAWLASLGYRVHLVDTVLAHVEAAAKVGTFTAAVGDARALGEADNSYDVALLLGPLYHLRKAEDRLRALQEARRVVRSGGLLVAAFISRSAVPIDSYVKGWIDKPGAIDTIRESVQNGFVNAERNGFSVISYYHLPSEARAELASAGLELLAVFGVEGPGWIASDFGERWQQPEGRQAILESARMVEEDPELQVLSGHLLAFCRCP